MTFISVTYGEKAVNDLSGYLLQTSASSVISYVNSYLEEGKGSLIFFKNLMDEFNIHSNSIKHIDIKVNPEEIIHRTDKIMNYFSDKFFRKYNISKSDLRTFLLKKLPETFKIVNYLHTIMNRYPDIYSLNYGDYNKDKISLKKMFDGSHSVNYTFYIFDKKLVVNIWDHSNIVFYNYDKINPDYFFTNELHLISNKYDVTNEIWFKGAEKNFDRAKIIHKKAQIYQSTPYVFLFNKVAGISLSLPIIDKHGDMYGVISSNVVIDKISSKYLSNLKVGKNGRVLILDSKANIVAYTPNSVKIKNKIKREISIQQELKNLIVKNKKSKKNQKKYTLMNIYNSNFSIYKSAFKAARFKVKNKKDIKNISVKNYLLSKSKQLTFNDKGKSYIGLMLPFPKSLSFRWFVCVLFPKSDFFGPIQQNMHLSVLITIITILISIVSAVILSNAVSAPITGLIGRMHDIREFKLDKKFRLPTQFLEFSELEKMYEAFLGMESGLKSFEKYVPADLVRSLISSGKEATLGGETKILTVYFSDVADFTSLAERLGPEKLVKILGEYLYEMSTIINKNKGTLDKYIGDAVMAFWGAPLEVKEHAYLACKAAIECQNRLTRLRYTYWSGENNPNFKSRIGINSGSLVVGNMGSMQRMNYTVIGDTVNLASRLEGLNKFYDVDIICSEYTYNLLDNRIITRKLDLVAVKGKKEPVAIFEVIGFDGEVSQRELRFIKNYEGAFELYLNREFEEAKKLYISTLNIKVDSTVNRFIKYCEEYIMLPPHKNWNGVYTFTRKK